MAKEYSIKEIAKLYGISSDILRHYEKKGLINPLRGENGYRMYNVKDIYRITIIRDLRALDVPIEVIGKYLKELSINSTKEFLQKEKEIISLEFNKLQKIRKSVNKQIEKIDYYSNIPINIPQIRKYNNRPCVLLDANIVSDEDIDLALKKLHSKHAKAIHDLGSIETGASMKVEDIIKGKFGKYKNVFIMLEDINTKADLLIEEGQYASIFYKGSYAKASTYAINLLSWINNQGKKPMGEMFEFYHIDNRYTINQEEFVSQLQVKVV